MDVVMNKNYYDLYFLVILGDDGAFPVREIKQVSSVLTELLPVAEERHWAIQHWLSGLPIHDLGGCPSCQVESEAVARARL